MATNTSNRNNMPKDSSSLKSYRDTSYREKPATPNSPSGTTVTTMYDHMLSPPSPAEIEEKDGRLRNDLLDEICNDMGIDDSMDLDFDDFCYNGQQRPGGSSGSQRFGTSGSSAGSSAEGRRPSATSASSYSTSDSLNAIAKLTHSIASDNATASGSEVDVKPRQSPDAHSVKQEPCDVETDSNDTDQGKAAAAAAGRLALQKQMSDCENSFDLKRKREMVTQEAPSEQAMSMIGSVPNQQQPAVSQRTQHDYSYQDDFAMEESDTMINFSELPQQPNYYQCPQTAGDNLNLGFNMSIHPSAHPGFPPSHPSASVPPAHQQTQHMGRFGFGGMPPQQPPNTLNMGRSSPQPRLQNPMHSTGQMPAQPSTSFQPYPGQDGGSSSGSASLQSQSYLHRSESFPGAVAQHSQFQSSSPETPTPKTAPVSGTSAQRSAASTTTTSRAATATGSSSQEKNDFLHQLISDGSSAFRSHPLFPLLRDLIIADVNFREKFFPRRLVVNLPSDFNKLLQNYLSRNPPKKDYQCMPSVESVLMDALKYAHHILIEKMNQWKQHEQLHEQQQPPMAAPDGSNMPSTMGRVPGTGEYCVGTLKHDIVQSPTGYGRTPMNVTKASTSVTFRPSRREPGSVYGGELGPPTPGSTYSQPLSVDTGSTDSPSSSRHTTPLPAQPPNNMYSAGPSHYPPQPQPVGYSRSPNPRNPYMTAHGGPPCPPPNYTVSPHNPPLSRHQQPMYDMGPPPSGPAVYNDPNTPYHDPYNSCMPPPPTAHRLQHMGPTDRHLLYENNINNGMLVDTIMKGGGKEMYDSMSDSASVMSGHSMQGSIKGQQQAQGKPTEGRKHASLPKEAVNIMLNWLREHQDKPYPNDDEKGMLIKQTGLSITQINYWFTNARRRLLPKWRGEDM